jgi:hypothetical protein
MHLHPLAIGLPVKNRVFAVFFQTPDLISNVQLGADSIEVTNADMDAELFLQCRLHFPAWRMFRREAESLQPLAHSFSQFGWMPVSSILESGVSPCLYRL